MKRRSFLSSAAAMTAGLWLPSTSARASFGVFPSKARSLQLPLSSQVESVLEVYLYGGLSPWETVYYVDDYGKNDGSFWYQYNEDVIGADNPDSNEFALSSCGVDAALTAPQFFANDELGNDVMTGPFAWALRARPDLVDRLRLVVQRHDLLPHEAAVPFALTGKKVGQPTMAGLGAHVQRAFSDELKRNGGARRTPFSYVLASAAAIPSDNTAAFVATGTHPGGARPLRINVDSAARLEQLLRREGVSDRAAHDALVEHYVARYRERLRFKGRGEPLRSPRFDALAEGARSLQDVDAIAATLDPALFDPINGDLCGSGETVNLVEQSLKLAAHLLTQAGERARYVCVVDSGLTVASGGGGYDTHTENSLVTSRNFTNLLQGLSSIIAAPGETGESAAGKIDLTKTLIILNTEFGRSPRLQEGAGGRNHHPNGYITALLGGPVPGRTIHGAIDENGEATSFATSAENRMAALLALGLWPYDNDAFVVADHAEPTTEEDGAAAVLQNVLGVQL